MFFNRYQTTYSHVSIRTCIRMLPGCFRDDLPMDCLFRHLPSEPKKHLPLLNLWVRLQDRVGYEQLANGAAMLPEPVLVARSDAVSL